MFKGIDLSSDTATKPTAAMKQMMFAAEVGDEQKKEDPTTLQLEKMIAEMLGFETALFLPSATMANQIAIAALCDRAEILLAAENAHILNVEGGGPAYHANVMCKPIATANGIFTAEDVLKNCSWRTGPYFSKATLLSIENTSNLGDGIAWSKDELQNVKDCARKLNLKLHLDGARFFNAVVATGLNPKEIAKQFDMITICLSKGLGCPMGALLVFNNNYYDKVLRLKHLFGGALRQSGIVAAAGIYALQNNIKRLEDDHNHAKILAKELAAIPEINVLNNPPMTNIIFFSLNSASISPQQFLQNCISNGLRFSQVDKNKFRAVTHLDISEKDIYSAVQIVKNIFRKKI